MRRSVTIGAFAYAVTGMLLFSLAADARASSINYGNLGPVPPGVSFLNIVESSGTDAVPLYGAPSAFPVGLTFSPTPAFSAAGASGASDLTDGQLNYTIASPSGVTEVKFTEGGLYTLIGFGTAATQSFAAASLRAAVSEINGVAVSPINLTPSVGSVAFNLIANSGLSQGWQIALTLDVAGQMAGLGYSANDLATRVDVVIDNQLVAISEAASQAMISKTLFGVTTQNVPEPATLALGAMALCGLAVHGARRRG